MKERNYIYLMLLGAAFMLSGCVVDGKDPDPDPDPTPGEEVAVRFGVDIPRQEKTESATRGFDNTLENLSSVGVYGYYTQTLRWSKALTLATLQPNYFCNTQLNKSGTSPDFKWNYEGTPRMWPPDTRNKVSYFAYAPYVATVDGAGAAIDLSTAPLVPFPALPTEDGEPVLQYTLPAQVRDHVDILWGSRLDMTRLGVDESLGATGDDNIVPFEMGHALTKITFSAKFSEPEDAEKYEVQVKEIEIDGIYTEGKLKLESGKWEFNPLSNKNTITLSMIDASLKQTIMNNGSTIYTLLNNQNDNAPDANNPTDVGALMLMPQSLEDATLTFNVQFENLNTGVIQTFPISFPLREINPQWESGVVIDYRLIVKGEFITVNTSIEMWKGGNKDGAANVTI